MPLIIGKAIAGNNRFADGRTFAEVYPEKYGNPLTDYVNLVIAEAKAKLSIATRCGIRFRCIFCGKEHETVEECNVCEESHQG